MKFGLTKTCNCAMLMVLVGVTFHTVFRPAVQVGDPAADHGGKANGKGQRPSPYPRQKQILNKEGVFS